MNKNFKLYSKLLICGCILCNLTQIPALYENHILGLASMGIWILLAGLMLFSERKIKAEYFILPIIFDLYCITMCLFKSGYISSSLFRPVNLSTFILLIGIWVGPYIDVNNLKKIAGAFIISAFFVSLYLYVDVFRGSNWATGGVYLFSAKNSAGQIFLTAIILILLFYFREHKICSLILCIFFTTLIIMMKSRTSLISIVLIYLYLILFVVKKKSHRLCGIFAIVVAVMFVLVNDNMHEFWIDQILLNNRGTDVTNILTGRDRHYKYFVDNFPSYCVFGNGGKYLESFPLAVLMSYGILGGSIVLIYSLFPLYVGIKNLKINEVKPYCHLIISTSVMMLFNGIFEEQSPFGPGVKCYILWLATGIMIGYKDRLKRRGIINNENKTKGFDNIASL